MDSVRAGHAAKMRSAPRDTRRGSHWHRATSEERISPTSPGAGRSEADPQGLDGACVMLDSGKLDQIQTLPKLLEYLRDSCDWPIDDIEIEDLVFDWDPKVLLGLNDADAFRHLEIKQLRPLTTNQPWGIFF